MSEIPYSPGLEGVIAAETAISYLDVDAEEIVVRGYNLLDLARTRTYVDVAALLVFGRLPDAEERARLERRLVEARVPEPVWRILSLLPPSMHAMDRLRTALSALAGFDPEADAADPDRDREKGFDLIGQVAVLVGNLARVATGEPPTSFTCSPAGAPLPRKSGSSTRLSSLTASTKCPTPPSWPASSPPPCPTCTAHSPVRWPPSRDPFTAAPTRR